jgi:hypothetical protein
MSDKQNTDQELLSFINEARRFLGAIDSPEWIGSAELTDAEHIEEMTSILRISREAHDLPERTVMHSVRSSRTGLIMASTGHTPRAADRARFLTGLLTALPRLLEGIEASLVREALTEVRINELIQSNNDKLFENRDQRQTIRQLQAQVGHLLSTIPTPVEAS